MKLKKHKSIICAALLACFITAGCSGFTDRRSFADFEYIEKEYLSTLDSLSLPDGIAKPAALYGEDTAASYQIGYGETMAYNFWEYSWMQEWLDSYKTDPARAEKAIGEIEKAFNMPYMSEEKCDDNTREYLRDAIDRAKNGDASGFIDKVN